MSAKDLPCLASLTHQTIQSFTHIVNTITIVIGSIKIKQPAGLRLFRGTPYEHTELEPGFFGFKKWGR